MARLVLPRLICCLGLVVPSAAYAQTAAQAQPPSQPSKPAADAPAKPQAPAAAPPEVTPPWPARSFAREECGAQPRPAGRSSCWRIGAYRSSAVTA